MGETLSKSLHSRYNPTREADRFVDSLQLPSTTTYIIVTEPGDSYIAGALRFRFPSANLIAIRLTDTLFSESDGLWNAVWRKNTGCSLEHFLLKQIPDESLNQTRYAEWPPAAENWPEAARMVRESLRSFLEIQKRVMLTRTCFGPRWLKNMADNIVAPASFAEAVPGTAPIFLAGAGPSLNHHAELALASPFTLTVSSALWLFQDKGIQPDLCIATDGGYWARRYFHKYPENCVLALPLEAAVPFPVLESCTILPLHYGSALETALYGCAGILAIPARRNGTVSGTAVELALSLTSGNVYASGLDFQSSASYHHARPHHSEMDVRSRSGRLNPEASFFFPKEDPSLEIYARWFEANAQTFNTRFTRVEPAGRPLAGIPETGTVQAKAAFDKSGRPARLSAQRNIPDRNERIQALRDYFNSLASRFEDGAEKITVDGTPPSADMAEFMQLADYRQYLETALLLGASERNSDSLKKMDALFFNMAVKARAMTERATLHGRY